MRFSRRKKNKVFKEVRQNVEGDLGIDLSGCPGLCIYWAAATVATLMKQGIRTAIQAGTAYWPRVPRNEWVTDDCAHFGYKWEGASSPLDQVSISMGNLPEMHIWAAILDTRELIDMTTWSWPAACKRMLGMDWQGSKPPNYFWANKPPAGVIYKVNLRATLYAFRVVEALHHGESATSKRVLEMMSHG